MNVGHGRYQRLVREVVPEGDDRMDDRRPRGDTKLLLAPLAWFALAKQLLS